MPGKNSKKGNTKGSKSGSGGRKVAAAAVASLPTSRPIPPVESLLPISEVMEVMIECGKRKGNNMVKDMLKAGQWLSKSVKGHNTYFRYVIIKGEVQPQTVTHSCSSGSKANLHRAGDLKNSKYTSVGGVQFVIRSKVVKGDPSLYPPR